MFTVRARALQSAVAAPANVSTRHGTRSYAGRPTALCLKVRGFRSAAQYRAPPEDPSKDDKPPSDSIACSGEGTHASAGTASASAPEGNTPAVDAVETARKAASTSAYVGGRSRGIRSRTVDGTPPYTLPEWFKRHHVRSFDNRPNEDKLASTSLAQDLEAASLLMYPRRSPAFSTEPETRPLGPIPYAKAARDPKPTLGTEVDPSDHDQIFDYFASIIEGSGWTDANVALAVEQLRAVQDLDAIARRGASVAAAAACAIAAAATHQTETTEKTDYITDGGYDDLYKRLDPHGVLDIPQTPFSSTLVEFVRLTSLGMNTRYLAAEAETSVKLGIPISTKFYERAMYRDLQASVAAGLLAPPPDAKAVRRDWRRPVTVLTMMQHSSPTMVRALMDEVTLSLSARVVHIDAKTIASLASPYLGQSPLLSRGTIATLGYTVARVNGGLASRYPKTTADDGTDTETETALGENANDGDGDSGSNGGISLSRLPMDFMSSTTTSRSALRIDAEDRWDDLKMNHVLEAIVRSADDEATGSKTRASTGHDRKGRGNEKPPVIIHLHNLIELSSNFDGNQVLYKLRGIVDRLWLKERRRLLLVGSSSISPSRDTSEMVDRMEELRQEDYDIFLYQLQLDHYQYTRRMEAASRSDVCDENVHNICEMVSALTGTNMVPQDIEWMARLKGHGDGDGSISRYANLEPVMASLQSGVYDIHQVYRIATLWAGLVKGGKVAGLSLEELDGCDASVNAIIQSTDGNFFNTFSDFSTALSPSSAAPASPASPAFPASEFTMESFLHTCWAATKFDQIWSVQGGAKGSHQLPLLIKRLRSGQKVSVQDLWPWSTPGQHGTAAHAGHGTDETSYVVPSRTSTESKAREDEKDAPARAAAAAASPPPAKPNYKKYNFNKHEQRLVQDIIDPAEITTTFDNIVLPAKTKESIQALTSLSLLRPDAFSYGVLATENIPGCLLYGPPGTGKTLLAKAVAKQSGTKMLEISAATMNSKYVGETEKNIRAAFTVARALAPIVLFIDEADALLASRNGEMFRTGHHEKINQFLREVDGLVPSKGGGTTTTTSTATNSGRVFLMVATNRPGDIDDAVLRRLPRRILVDLPLRDARLAILRVMLRAEQLDDATLSLDKIANDTELYSGSDLKNLCVAAAMQAVRDEMAAMEAFQAQQSGDSENKSTKEEYVFPARRTLTGKHFEQALHEIGASISENMASLKAIRKFDEQYGDQGGKKRKKKQGGMGFEVVPRQYGTKEAMVRKE